MKQHIKATMHYLHIVSTWHYCVIPSCCFNIEFALQNGQFSPLTLVSPFRWHPVTLGNFFLLHYCCCSLTKSCVTLCDPMDCSTPGNSVLHCLPEFAQIHAHWVSDAIQPSHPLPPPSPFAFNFPQHNPVRIFIWKLYQHIIDAVSEMKLIIFHLKRVLTYWLCESGKISCSQRRLE